MRLFFEGTAAANEMKKDMQEVTQETFQLLCHEKEQKLHFWNKS